MNKMITVSCTLNLENWVKLTLDPAQVALQPTLFLD